MKCRNCKRFYNKEPRAPRVLQCGHTFCHWCLSTNLIDNEVTCFVCEFKQTAYNITDIPYNHDTRESVQVKETKNNNLSKDDLCLLHNKKIIQFCKKCKEFTCDECYGDLHKDNYGCIMSSVADGFVSFLEDYSENSLNNSIKAFNQKKKNSVDKPLEHLENLQSAFETCLWSIKKEKAYYEFRHHKMKETLVEMSKLKDDLKKCSLINEFFKTVKRINLSLAIGEADAEKLSNQYSLSFCDVVWQKLPIVVTYLQGLVERSKGKEVYAIERGDTEEDIACQLIFTKYEGTWINLNSTTPATDVPEDAFTFKIDSAFEDYLTRSSNDITIIWNNSSTQLDTDLINISCDTILAKIQLHEDITQAIRDSFFHNFLRADDYSLNDFSKHPYLFIFGYSCPRIGKFNTCDDYEKGDKNNCILLSNLNVRQLHNYPTVDRIELDPSRGCAVLVNENYDRYVFLKVPLKYATKNFKLVGYCKDGIKGHCSKDVMQNWHTYLKMC